MTFIEVYKDLLASQLKEQLKVETTDPETEIVVDTKITDVIFSSGLQYEPLNKNPTAVCGIVRAGNATKSTLPGYDSNEEIISITLYCAANNIDKLLRAVTDLSTDGNAVYGSLTANSVEYSYRTVFNTPYVVGAPYDLSTTNGTIKAINAVWIMTVNYSSNALMPIPEDILTIGGVDYDIDYLVSADQNEIPNYDQSQKQNATLISYRRINTTRTFVYTVREVLTGSDLQSLIKNSIFGVTETIGAIILKVKENTSYISIPISAYNFSRSWIGGVAAITISLFR